MSQAQRRYRIEETEAFASAPAAAPVPADGLAELSAKMNELHDLLRPARDVIVEMAGVYRRELLDAAQIRGELGTINAAIDETKRQVGAIRARSVSNAGVEMAAGELGAVVEDTERATNAILGSAEQIEMLAGVLQSDMSEANVRQRSDEIAALTQTIYEACNFQDLTGQRIARVCDTLEFISQRVQRMVEAWGGSEALDAIVAREAQTLDRQRLMEGTHALAQGPRLSVADDGHVDQADIDRLFD
jgi:chemotaxis protein CheZ